MYMCIAANNYFTPASQNDLKNSKQSTQTKILSSHNILKFFLLFLFCMTEMLSKSNRKI